MIESVEILGVIKDFVERHGLSMSTWAISHKYGIPCGHIALITNDPTIKEEISVISVSYDGDLQVTQENDFECHLGDPKCFDKLAKFLEAMYG